MHLALGGQGEGGEGPLQGRWLDDWVEGGVMLEKEVPHMAVPCKEDAAGQARFKEGALLFITEEGGTVLEDEATGEFLGDEFVVGIYEEVHAIMV